MKILKILILEHASPWLTIYINQNLAHTEQR